jgi:D-3-phosphoglycerate dehydrogenase
MRFGSLFFDFDSTIVDVETLDVLAEAALDGNPDKARLLSEIKDTTTQAMEGRIPFTEALTRRMGLIAPRREHVSALAERLVSHISPSFLEHLDFFKKNRDRIYILSGGFDEVIFPVADRLGVSRAHVFANTFVYDERGNVTGVDAARPLAQPLGKVLQIRKLGVGRPLIMIGDGYTDYEVKLHGAADAFVAYVEHARREPVIAGADFVAKSFGDLLSYLED